MHNFVHNWKIIVNKENKVKHRNCFWINLILLLHFRLLNLQELILSQTSIPVECQYLIHDSRLLSDLVTSTTAISCYPNCSEENPIIVYDLRRDVTVLHLSPLKLCTSKNFFVFSMLHSSLFSSANGLFSDINITSACTVKTLWK